MQGMLDRDQAPSHLRSLHIDKPSYAWLPWQDLPATRSPIPYLLGAEEDDAVSSAGLAGSKGASVCGHGPCLAAMGAAAVHPWRWTEGGTRQARRPP